ncbi:MAG: response regulator [Thermoguttaceae bacterium]
MDTNLISPTLLITDDDDAFRESLRDLFEPEGFRTFLAEDGLAAYEIVKSEQIHIALFDMHMPRLNGLEAIKRVHEIHPSLPCILISGALDDLIIQAAMDVYAFSVLPKPCSRQLLTKTVRLALTGEERNSNNRDRKYFQEFESFLSYSSIIKRF